jgi:putative protease
MFHQVTGCEKNHMDETCISDCAKSASITNLKGVKFQIEKTPGNFNGIYNSVNLLNTDIVTDLTDLFSGYLVDLSDVKTDTQTIPDKLGVVKLFENHLNSIPGSAEELHRQISPTSNSQYTKGI